jgi:hypothetical protein
VAGELKERARAPRRPTVQRWLRDDLFGPVGTMTGCGVISLRRGFISAGAVVRGASHAVPACASGQRSGSLRRAARSSPPSRYHLISAAAPGLGGARDSCVEHACTELAPSGEQLAR